MTHNYTKESKPDKGKNKLYWKYTIEEGDEFNDICYDFHYPEGSWKEWLNHDANLNLLKEMKKANKPIGDYLPNNNILYIPVPTGEKHKKTEIKIKVREPKMEMVIIVGAEGVYSTAGNKSMFMAQTVRFLRKYKKFFDCATVYLFRGNPKRKNDTYTHPDSHVKLLKESVENYEGKLIIVNSWNDVVKNLKNNKVVIEEKRYKPKIQVLVFFTHSTPGQIWLDNKNKIFFTIEESKLLTPKMFAKKGTEKYPNVRIIAFGCQVANNGKDKDDKDKKFTIEERMSMSLAQKVADICKVDVIASATRTDFSDSWDGKLINWLGEPRYEVDNFLWEKGGADNQVNPGKTSDPDNAMPSGFYKFSPGQKTNYQKTNPDLD